MVDHLFPVMHIHDTGSGWVVSYNNIIPLVVVKAWVAIHQFSEDVTTDMREIVAEENTFSSLEPIETWQELMNAHKLIPAEKTTFINKLDESGFLVVYVGNWPEAEILVDQALNDWIVQRHGDVHLHCSL